MKVENRLIKAVSDGFNDMSVFDWIMLALAVLRALSEFLQSDGNGGLKLKDDD